MLNANWNSVVERDTLNVTNAAKLNLQCLCNKNFPKQRVNYCREVLRRFLVLAHQKHLV